LTYSTLATREHALALTKIREWFASPEPQVFRLFGLAGTGKTTLAREVADMVLGKVAFVAFAGKAAMALRQRGCLSATTIHSLIYNVVEDYIGKVHFTLKRQAPQCELVIVDECSTVDADVAKDLLSYNIPVLTLGDPFQLPSIDGIEFFMKAKPDATLTEVLRQEKNSPILELAARVESVCRTACADTSDLSRIREHREGDRFRHDLANAARPNAVGHVGGPAGKKRLDGPPLPGRVGGRDRPHDAGQHVRARRLERWIIDVQVVWRGAAAGASRGNRRRRDGRRLRLHVQMVWRGAAAGVSRPSRRRRDCRRLRDGVCFSPSPRLCRPRH
jgi:hypothetical protein